MAGPRRHAIADLRGDGLGLFLLLRLFGRIGQRQQVAGIGTGIDAVLAPATGRAARLLRVRSVIAAAALLEAIAAIASGRETAAERNGEREIAIWKRGVTL